MLVSNLKKMSKLQILLCFLISVAMKATAQDSQSYYTGTLTNFQVSNSNGIQVQANTSTTTINFSVWCSRFAAPPGEASMFQPFKMNFKLGLDDGTQFSTVYTMYSWDFQYNQGFNSKNFIASVSNGSLKPDRKLVIYYNVPSYGNSTYSQSHINSVTIVNPYYVYPPGTTNPSNPPSYSVPVIGSVPLYEYYNSTTGVHFYSTTWTGVNFSSILGYVFNTQVSGTVPLYRYYESSTGKYYYSTIYASSFGTFVYFDIACYVYDSPVTKTRPVSEHFNPSNADHYYFDGPGTFSGYNLQGIKFHILQNPQQTTYPLPEDDTMELYEYYSTNGDHFYTTLKKDRPGFTYIKVLGYVHTIQKPGTVPLYRYYAANTLSGDHYYTTVQQNYSSYVYEGVVGYVYNNGNTSGTIPIYEYYTTINSDHYYNTVLSTPQNYGYYGIPFYMLQYNH
jgi:hypothetical protein